MSALFQLVCAFLASPLLGSVIFFLWRRLRRDPKTEAEARKLNAEAERIDWQTLRDEIDRQNLQIRSLREEIHAMRNKMASREAELEAENKRLRAEVARLTTRVQGLENIFKVPSTPEDMKRMLAELDRKTAKRGHQ